MEAADANRQAGGAKRPGEVNGARELVRLHPDQPDQRPTAGFADRADDPFGADPLVGFVKGVEADFNRGPEHPGPPRIPGEPVEAGERVRRDRGLDPADRIAVIVVMGRLDQYEVEDGRVAAPRPGRHRQPRR